MRNILISIAALSFSLPSAAAIVTFEYSGTIQSIKQWNGGMSPDTVLSETSIIPGSVRLGDTFRGRFSFDTDAPSWFLMAPYTANYGGPDAVAAPATTLQFDRGGLSLASQAQMPTVQLGYFDTRVGPGPGYVIINPYFNTSTSNEPSNVNVSLRLSDGDSTALQGYALPTALNPAAFKEHTLDLTWFGDNNQTFFVAGDLTSIVNVSAVPEPSTYALLALGLIGIGGTVRRRKLSLMS